MTIDEDVTRERRASTTELKASLLSKGVRFDIDMFRNIKAPFYDNQFVYGKTSARVTPAHRFPQVLVLGDGVVSALLRRENTPWNLKSEDNQVNLYHSEQFVRTVQLPERPPYFDKRLSDGTRSESIIAVAGEDTPGFFFLPDCYYFPEGMACGFCSMRSTRRSVGKNMVSEFTQQNIREATRLFQQTPWRDIPLISITMGTARTDEETRRQVIEPIRWMYDSLETKIPIHILAHPPNDFGLIEEFRNAGVTSIAFNLEVYDRQRFQKVCLGKATYYGYDKWIDALMHAREVFGRYKAYCGLVWGLEAPESSIEGHARLLEEGIGIASNIFHADPRSSMGKYPQPTEDQILQIATTESDIYRTNPQVGTIFSVSMRSTIDWEVHRGDLR